MEGVRERELDPVGLDGAALVRARASRRLGALLPEPVVELDQRDDSRPRTSCVSSTVSPTWSPWPCVSAITSTRSGSCSPSGHFGLPQPGVDVDPLAAGRVDPEARVAEPGHRHVGHARSFLTGRLSITKERRPGRRTIGRMGRRWIPVALVLAAAAADGAGAHGVAFYALLAACRRRRSQRSRRSARRWTSRAPSCRRCCGRIVLALTVAGAAVRAPLLDAGHRSGARPLGGRRLPGRLLLPGAPRRRHRAAPLVSSVVSCPRVTWGVRDGTRRPHTRVSRTVRRKCDFSEDRGCGVLRDVDQRLHDEERADRHDERRADRGLQHALRGGEPPTTATGCASCSSSAGRMYIARITPR